MGGSILDVSIVQRFRQETLNNYTVRPERSEKSGLPVGPNGSYTVRPERSEAESKDALLLSCPGCPGFPNAGNAGCR